MLAYIIRRILYAIPIVVGVNVLTALLFFYINTPDDMARKILGEKNVTPAAIENWKRDHGYNLPSFVNTKEEGLKKVTETVFFQKSLPLLWFDFGRSDRNNIDIGHEIRTRMWASLAISVPMFMAGLVLSLFFAMILAYYRATYIDIWGIVLAVIVTLALILTPSIANFINDSRSARARNDVQTIAVAITQFFKERMRSINRQSRTRHKKPFFVGIVINKKSNVLLKTQEIHKGTGKMACPKKGDLPLIASIFF